MRVSSCESTLYSDGSMTAVKRWSSPLVRQHLQDLDHTETGNTSLHSLRQHVRQMEPAAIPRLLHHMADSKPQTSSRTYAVALYEECAKAHGPLIIPHIPRMAASIVRSLASNGSSPQFHQVCARVTVEIAAHAPTDAAQAEEVMEALCAPLGGSLGHSHEPLATGAAVCLHALVCCERWKLAAPRTQEEVARATVAALTGHAARGAAHVQLACALAKSSPHLLQVYAKPMVEAAEEVLIGAQAWQQRLFAARLIREALTRCDEATFRAEADTAIAILDECRADKVPRVRQEVADALQLVRALQRSWTPHPDEDEPQEDETTEFRAGRGGGGAYSPGVLSPGPGGSGGAAGGGWPSSLSRFRTPPRRASDSTEAAPATLAIESSPAFVPAAGGSAAKFRHMSPSGASASAAVGASTSSYWSPAAATRGLAASPAAAANRSQAGDLAGSSESPALRSHSSSNSAAAMGQPSPSARLFSHRSLPPAYSDGQILPTLQGGDDAADHRTPQMGGPTSAPRGGFGGGQMAANGDFSMPLSAKLSHISGSPLWEGWEEEGASGGNATPLSLHSKFASPGTGTGTGTGTGAAGGPASRVEGGREAAERAPTGQGADWCQPARGTGSSGGDGGDGEVTRWREEEGRWMRASRGPPAATTPLPKSESFSFSAEARASATRMRHLASADEDRDDTTVERRREGTGGRLAAAAGAALQGMRGSAKQRGRDKWQEQELGEEEEEAAEGEMEEGEGEGERGFSGVTGGREDQQWQQQDKQEGGGGERGREGQEEEEQMDLSDDLLPESFAIESALSAGQSAPPAAQDGWTPVSGEPTASRAANAGGSLTGASGGGSRVWGSTPHSHESAYGTASGVLSDGVNANGARAAHGGALPGGSTTVQSKRRPGVSTEDMLPSATPRRLLISLQSGSPAPVKRPPPSPKGNSSVHAAPAAHRPFSSCSDQNLPPSPPSSGRAPRFCQVSQDGSLSPPSSPFGSGDLCSPTSRATRTRRLDSRESPSGSQEGSVERALRGRRADVDAGALAGSMRAAGARGASDEGANVRARAVRAHNEGSEDSSTCTSEKRCVLKKCDADGGGGGGGGGGRGFGTEVGNEAKVQGGGEVALALDTQSAAAPRGQVVGLLRVLSSQTTSQGSSRMIGEGCDIREQAEGEGRGGGEPGEREGEREGEGEGEGRGGQGEEGEWEAAEGEWEEEDWDVGVDASGDSEADMDVSSKNDGAAGRRGRKVSAAAVVVGGRAGMTSRSRALTRGGLLGQVAWGAAVASACLERALQMGVMLAVLLPALLLLAGLLKQQQQQQQLGGYGSFDLPPT